MQLLLERPSDFHVHLRQGDMLRLVAPLSAAHFGTVLVMPNTTPPVLTGEDALSYRVEILRAVEGHPGGSQFDPRMTIKLIQTTTPETIAQAARVGVIAAKLYPVGVTTNSNDGVTDILELAPVFAAMEEAGMVLCLHAEEPGVFVLDREEAFLDRWLQWLTTNWPLLHIVVEHLTTSAGVAYVASAGPYVAATITAHHLALTLDDVIGGELHPHHFCKPVAKRARDREMLIGAATRGPGRKFFLGTDSAPHSRNKKECASGCAGVFTAPIAIPLLAEIFEKVGQLGALSAFVSAGDAFYGVHKPALLRPLIVEKCDWRVPESYGPYGPVIPLMAGKTLSWKVRDD